MDIDENEVFDYDEMYYDDDMFEEMYKEKKAKFDDISDVDNVEPDNDDKE